MKCGCGRAIVLTEQERAVFQTARTFESWRVVDAMKIVRAKCTSDGCRGDWGWAEAIVADVCGVELSRVREMYDEYLEWLNGR